MVDEALSAFYSSVASLLRLIAVFCVYNCYITQRTILAEGSEGVLLGCACGIYIPGHPSHLGTVPHLLEGGAALQQTLRFTSFFGPNAHGTCGFNKYLISNINSR